ncbi:hypothetical protein NC653_028834 [Populus alba x Populus x berolinensis]|uniref:Uncharacterized protein n=1 Tax=Populus alba x Populus x berolinensis TaxID=444605 RepID=A0AAD6M0W4_9ROSI|nr:hypothetical protein NC653_028834 [Populus alba x Populus x berolinensis]
MITCYVHFGRAMMLSFQPAQKILTFNTKDSERTRGGIYENKRCQCRKQQDFVVSVHFRTVREMMGYGNYDHHRMGQRQRPRIFGSNTLGVCATAPDVLPVIQKIEAKGIQSW